MSRLTNDHYLEKQHWLASAWQTDQRALGRVSPAEQWALHDYFVPSWSLTDEQLLAYRAKVSRDQPSLPQRAGRALTHLNRELEELEGNSMSTASSETVGSRRVIVNATVRPGVDADGVVKALLLLAESMDRDTERDRPAA